METSRIASFRDLTQRSGNLIVAAFHGVRVSMGGCRRGVAGALTELFGQLIAWFDALARIRHG